MVQRLALYGQLADAELPLARQCVEALCGMHAREFAERRQSFRPCVAGDLYRLSLVSADGETRVESCGLPEAGNATKVVSQPVFAARVADGGGAALLRELGYVPDSACTLAGFEVVRDRAVVLRVFRVLDEDGAPVAGVSAQHVVVMFVDVDKVTDLAAVEQATQLILRTQQELKGVVAFRQPQRQAFDTRMPR